MDNKCHSSCPLQAQHASIYCAADDEGGLNSACARLQAQRPAAHSGSASV